MPNNNKSFVAILMGSQSDWPIMQETTKILQSFEVPFEVKVTSAHRTPDNAKQYVQSAVERGCSAFICAAGMAAHLAGFVAANSLKPVIGVPLDSGSLNGMDALLSTVQMPGGVPVACTAIGKAGAMNAAYLAVQILALQQPSLSEKLANDRENRAKKIIESNETLFNT